MASTSTKPKSKTTKTSGKEDTDKTTLLDHEFVQSSSGSSPGQATANPLEDESVIEPISNISSNNISPTPYEAATAASDPGTQNRFQLVLDELLQTMTDLRFLPMTRLKSLGRTVQRRALSEGNVRAASNNDGRGLELGGYQYLGSDEPADQDFISRKNSDEDPPLVPYRTWKELYFDYSVYAANSYFIVPLLLLLCGFGCFTFYMGIKYFNQCKLLKDGPICFVFMGVSALIGLLSRIIYILTKRRWFARFEMCRCGTLVSILIFGICYAAESMNYIFRKSNPSADKGPEYCHPFFYNYIFWYNWAVLGIIIILVVVHWHNSCHYIG